MQKITDQPSSRYKLHFLEISVFYNSIREYKFWYKEKFRASLCYVFYILLQILKISIPLSEKKGQLALLFWSHFKYISFLEI